MSRSRKRRPITRSRSPQRRRGEKQQPKVRRVGPVTITVVVVTALIATLVILAVAEEAPAPVEQDPVAVAAGEELYIASCAVCHGADLGGSATGPPFLVPTYAPNHHADEAFQRAVAFGVQPHHWNFGTMAPIEGLSRDDVSKIVAYVRSVQESEGILRDPAHP